MLGLLGEVALALTISIIFFIGGWFVCTKVRRRKIGDAQDTARSIIGEARKDAEALKKTATLEARDQWRREREPLDREIESSKRSLRDLEGKLLEREHQLDRKVDLLEGKERQLTKTETEMEKRADEIQAEESCVEVMVQQQQQRLESLAGMSRDEARRRLIERQEDRARQLAARKVKEIKDEAIANANREAKEIIARSIQRFAGELSVENSVSAVNIPTDEMKGRIIGRDGRNIRSFEMITGVEVIVDDTPGLVTLSGFDPLRRNIAKHTLEKLIQDGRIHPGRIEEVYEKAREDVEEQIHESGSKAAFDLGIHDLAEQILDVLGKLQFHSSYGQNLLVHSQEVAVLAGMMAEALELDVPLARRAGLLHDIGKGLSLEVGGDPIQSGAALTRKYGESSQVVSVIETHATDTPFRSAISVLVAAANEISVDRPGACNEKLEQYTKRLRAVEEIAGAQPGVENAFALQNGREIRVLVNSEQVDDAYADQLADDIVERLEEELEQPGQMKVCVIREVRAVHYAR
jgi:ribonuclease Y